jgi:beta-lactamase class A
MTTAITDRLQQLIRQSRASEVAIAAHRKGSGAEILINADQPFHPASTIKLCIMMETFHQARQGKLSLDDPIVIKNQFSSIVDGSPYSLEVEDDSETELYRRIDQSFPRRELVRRMITVSSNLATNLLIEDLEPNQINGFMKELGAEGLITRRGVEDKAAFRRGLNNAATARSLMNALRKLAKREVVSPEDSDEMIQILSDQQFNEMMPALLPSGVRVAHKTGSTGDYFHDAGIVYPSDGEPFVLAILTKGYPEDEDAAAYAFIASLSRAIYDYWNP